MRLFKGCLYSIAIIILAVSGIAVGFSAAYKGKILPGVKVNSLSLEYRTPDEAQVLLEKYLTAYSKNPLLLELPGNRVTVYPDELGFSFDIKGTAQKAYLVGREGSIVTRTQESLKALHTDYTLTPQYTIDESKLTQFVDNLSLNNNRDNIPSRYTLSPSGLSWVVGTQGYKINQEELAALLQNKLISFQYGLLTVPVVEETPILNETELGELYPKALERFRQSIIINFQGRIWQATPEEKVTFLMPSKKTADATPTLEIDSGAIDNFIRRIAKDVNIEPKGGIFDIKNGKVTTFSLPIDGKEVDMDASRERLFNTILSGISEVISLPVKITKAGGLTNQYGIYDLLGQGTTTFAGSSAGRIHNVELAASRVSGTLVEPAGIFSFNNSVGEITAATGYDQAYIISERRTQLGTGGGVCQVSTTVYRAALYSGLEILDRTPHAYRVGYYEPAGMDATVYAPSTDLKFKNNTEHYILVWSIFERSANKLTFQIYGTNDGRKVTLEGPVITPGGAPPAPLYQEDPSLPPGTTKQVDFAASGATTIVKRKVEKAGEIIIDEQIKTVYSPWQAIFLVGPSKD